MAQARCSRTRLLRPREILPAHSRPWHTGVAPVREDEARRQSVPSRRAGIARRPARRLGASTGKDPRHKAPTRGRPAVEGTSARRACSVRPARGQRQACIAGQRPTQMRRRRGCAQAQTPRLPRERRKGDAWSACVRPVVVPPPPLRGVRRSPEGIHGAAVNSFCASRAGREAYLPGKR